MIIKIMMIIKIIMMIIILMHIGLHACNNNNNNRLFERKSGVTERIQAELDMRGRKR